MKFATIHNLPELVSLPKDRRTAVWKACRFKVLESRSMCAAIGLAAFVCGGFAFFGIHCLENEQELWGILLLAIGGGCAGVLTNQVALRQMRPHIRAYLQADDPS